MSSEISPLRSVFWCLPFWQLHTSRFLFKRNRKDPRPKARLLSGSGNRFLNLSAFTNIPIIRGSTKPNTMGCFPLWELSTNLFLFVWERVKSRLKHQFVHGFANRFPNLRSFTKNAYHQKFHQTYCHLVFPILGAVDNYLRKHHQRPKSQISAWFCEICATSLRIQKHACHRRSNPNPVLFDVSRFPSFRPLWFPSVTRKSLKTWIFQNFHFKKNWLQL